jgi:hypothetical protein
MKSKIEFRFIERFGNRILKTCFVLAFVLLFALSLGLMSMKNNMYDVKGSTGEVNQIEGLYIFTDSKPVKETEFLGSVKAGVTMSGSYSQIINKIARKARKEYPNADAIIFNGEEKADVVKFK